MCRRGLCCASLFFTVAAVLPSDVFPWHHRHGVDRRTVLDNITFTTTVNSANEPHTRIVHNFPQEDETEGISTSLPMPVEVVTEKATTKVRMDAHALPHNDTILQEQDRHKSDVAPKNETAFEYPMEGVEASSAQSVSPEAGGIRDISGSNVGVTTEWNNSFFLNSTSVNFEAWNPTTDTSPESEEALLQHVGVPDDFVPLTPSDNSDLNASTDGSPASTSTTGNDGNGTWLPSSEASDSSVSTSATPTPTGITRSGGNGALSDECVYNVGGIEIDARYVDKKCSGMIQVAFEGATGQFHPRRLKVVNKRDEGVTLIMKTVNARSPPVIYSSISMEPTFVQLTSDTESDAVVPAENLETRVLNMLKNLENATSFMQTDLGASKVQELCSDVLSSVKNAAGFSCEMLAAVDMAVLQIPPSAGLDKGQQAYTALRTLLEVGGGDILDWELSTTGQLQMLPPDVHLPLPARRLPTQPSLSETRSEICATLSMAECRTSDDSPKELEGKLPADPDVEQKLWGLYDARCVHAWLLGEKSTKSVLVSIVDSGIAAHPELDSVRWKNPGEVVDGVDNDENGYVDDVYGWNFYDENNDTSDVNGHGTHVAGTIGAIVNGETIVGCAPEASVMSVRQFGNDGKGSLGAAVRGFSYALLRNPHIINNSWGSDGYAKSLGTAIDRSRHSRGGLGVLVVNAAGNNGSNNDIIPFYPSSIACINCISVGAYTPDGAMASFSNYGPNSVLTLAPGERIYSALPGPDYGFLSGTSMAAPHVSGVAALIYGVYDKANSEVSAVEVKDIMKETLKPLPAAVGTTVWEGVPDAMNAVLMARLGGMWCQMKCTDMVLDLDGHESYAPTLFVRGYLPGNYTADFQIEVLNSKGESLGKLNIPFALSSSTAPEQNNPSDAEAASAFANVAKVLTTTNPICGIQLQYTGDSEDSEGLSATAIAAISLGCIVGAIIIALAGFIIHRRISGSSHPRREGVPLKSPKKEKGETPSEVQKPLLQN